jgi:hypothetical protein
MKLKLNRKDQEVLLESVEASISAYQALQSEVAEDKFVDNLSDLMALAADNTERRVRLEKIKERLEAHA